MIRRTGSRFLRVPSTALIPTLLIVGLGAGLASGPLGCARNPVTGKSELSLVSESQEIEMGKQASQEVAQTIGIYNDNNIQSYVAGLGKSIAVKTERPNLPWEFHVVDDASVNAFALPGWVHLRDPRPDDLHQRRSGAGHGRGARDRPRHQPAFSPANQ